MELERSQRFMELERSLSAASDIFEDAEEGLEMDEEFSEASEPASLGDDEDSQVKQFLLNMIKKHCMKTPVFVGAKTDQEILDILKDLETWEPPEYLRKNFPYYYSGRGQDGKPIWIIEAGKFDVRALTNQGPEVLNAIDKAMVQAAQLVVKSMFHDGKFHKIQGLADLEGMHFSKLASPSAMSMLVQFTKRYRSVAEEILGEGVVINANQFVEYVINKLRPIISKVLKKVKVYGKNEAVWRPRLQRSFPDNALPQVYGGSLSDQPIYALQYCSMYRDITFGAPFTQKNFISV